MEERSAAMLRGTLLDGLVYTGRESEYLVYEYDATWKCETEADTFMDCRERHEPVADWCRSCIAKQWLEENPT